MISSMLALGLLVAAPGLLQAMPHEKDLPGAEGGAVYQYITETNSYEQWALWPGKGRFYPGTEPHGALLTTHVNETALEALKIGQKPPEGSIIVKENYTPAKELAAVTVMYKKTGYNPQAGDYFWLKYAPDGKIQAEGKVDSWHQVSWGGQGKRFSVHQRREKVGSKGLGAPLAYSEGTLVCRKGKQEEEFT